MSNCKNCLHYSVCMWSGQKQDDCGFYSEERKGHWFLNYEHSVGFSWLTCSICLYRVAAKENFCPNCGAKMEMEGEEWHKLKLICANEGIVVYKERGKEE